LSVISIQDVNLYSLCESFENAIARSRSGEVITNVETTVDIKLENDLMFNYDPTYNKITNLNQNYEDIIKDIFKMSGTYEMNFEFTPNNHLNIRSNNTHYFYNNNTFSKKMETFNAYKAWFQNIFYCFSGRIILIPDTNILVYCYYSNYLKDMSNKTKIEFLFLYPV
jgi:hypothetical protein